jgi:hypothetical protein
MSRKRPSPSKLIDSHPAQPTVDAQGERGDSELSANLRDIIEQGARPAPRRPSRRAASRRKEALRVAAKLSRSDSKQARVVTMLQRKQGATIAAIMEATGWMPHSVRGFLTAVVRKKLGLTLASEKTDEERVYRIVTNDVAPKRRGRRGRKTA